MGQALEILRFIARHGRGSLVLGLIGGFALPGLALAMKPALPYMVAFLVFVSALRIGARAALGNLQQAGGNLGLVLILQLAMPLAGRRRHAQLAVLKDRNARLKTRQANLSHKQSNCQD